MLVYLNHSRVTLTKHVARMREFPGRVITTDVLASITVEVYPVSFTPVNIMSGFKKCG